MRHSEQRESRLRIATLDIPACMYRGNEKVIPGDVFDCRSSDVVVWECRRIGSLVSMLPLHPRIIEVVKAESSCSECELHRGSSPRWISGEMGDSGRRRCRR